MYKLNNYEGIVRAADNAHIPKDPNNTDYSEYLKWAEGGGVVALPPIPAGSITWISATWSYFKSLTGVA